MRFSTSASIPPAAPASISKIPFIFFGILGPVGYYFYDDLFNLYSEGKYDLVYNEIARKLENNDYDDGSIAPLLLRLAWHAAGTWDGKTGGSEGATMRFKPESLHGANSGLSLARDILDDVKKKYSWISYSDLWSLGGVAAIQEMVQCRIICRAGQRSLGDMEEKMQQLNNVLLVFYFKLIIDGRLPDASKGSRHIRDVFGRMGFNDQEMVSLIGAHAVGRCHTDRSGFDGPWT
jgi:cytochrome c peroxidase